MRRSPRLAAVALLPMLLGLLGATATTIPTDYRAPKTSNTYTPLPTTQPATTTQPALQVTPVPDDLRQRFHIHPFYKRSLLFEGIPIIGSEKVSDYAFLECAFTLDHMLAESPAWVRQAILDSHVRVGILSVVEYTMDIPENQTRRNMIPANAAFQDRRSRGLGGLPLATCAEENLLNLRGDRYIAENITIHEFSHTVASAIRRARPEWYEKLRDTYNLAMKEGLFAHSYSATNEQEYWAEGAQAWFDCASPHKDPSVHSGIWNRDQLRAYDPRLADLLQEVYGDGSWRYVKTTNQPVHVGDVTFTRSDAELSHLKGIDRSAFPTFNFNNSPRIAATQKAPNPE